MAYYGHDWQESARAIRTAIEGEPDLPEAWHILGISPLALGQYDGAIHALTKPTNWSRPGFRRSVIWPAPTVAIHVGQKVA